MTARDDTFIQDMCRAEKRVESAVVTAYQYGVSRDRILELVEAAIASVADTHMAAAAQERRRLLVNADRPLPAPQAEPDDRELTPMEIAARLTAQISGENGPRHAA